MSKRVGPITLDIDAADKITVLTLKQQRAYLKKELDDYKKGKWLHPDDVASNAKLVEALNLTIRYFGD